MVKQSLLAVRQNAVAIIAMVDAILALESAPSASGGECAHPADQRIPAPRMGAPAGYVCGACGQESE